MDLGVIGLQALCERAGLTGEDAHSSIRRYVHVGPLTDRDRATLCDLTAEARDTVLDARYGSDGARVALIVAGL